MKAKCKANKLLAMLLSLVMLIGLLSTTALAADKIAVTEVNFTLSGYELGKKVVDVKPAISTNGVTWYSNYASYGEGAYLVAQGDDGEIRRGITDDTVTFAANTQYWLVVWFKAVDSYDISALAQENIKLNEKPAAEITIFEGGIAAFFKLDKLTGSTPASSYTVSFNANGGSGSMADVTDVSGSYTLPTCTFTAPAGKQFKGWATSAEGNVISGTSIEVSENTMLYAIWENISSTLTAITEVNFTLSGYERDKKVVDINLATSTIGVTWDGENKYYGAYAVLQGEYENTPSLIPADSAATFAADTQYWLSVSLKAVDGYDISTLTQEKIKLNGVAADGFSANITDGRIHADFKLNKLTGSTPASTAVSEVNFTLSGYERGKKIVEVKPAISTTGVAWNGENEYQGAYAVWQSEDDPNSIPKIIPDDSTDKFAAGTQYWLSVLFKAADGYNISALKTENIKLNGVAADNSAITTDGGIEAYFKLNKLTGSSTGGGGGSHYTYYTITASADDNGSISPSGSVSVLRGADKTFTITPNDGYAVAKVLVDGKDVGAVKSYTFEDVKTGHTISVVFMEAKSDPQAGVFVDVETGSYYGDAVDWAVSTGITKGTTDTTFSPDGICTRAQAVTFLWRAAGSPAPKSSAMPFTDVPAGSYYYDAVLWAVEQGITVGTSEMTFSPNLNCTRAQIVTFLWRSEKSPAAGTVNPFTDVKSNTYYADGVLWAVGMDITKGTTAATFSPDDDCTRAQIVTFLYRAYQAY